MRMRRFAQRCIFLIQTYAPSNLDGSTGCKNGMTLEQLKCKVLARSAECQSESLACNTVSEQPPCKTWLQHIFSFTNNQRKVVYCDEIWNARANRRDEKHQPHWCHRIGLYRTVRSQRETEKKTPHEVQIL